MPNNHYTNRCRLKYIFQGLTFLKNSCNYDPPGILLEFRPSWIYSWTFITVLGKTPGTGILCDPIAGMNAD